LAAIRFFSAQTRLGGTLADPNWIFEFSRRWRLHWSLIDHSGLQLYFGAGAACKNETDDINGSRLNFAEQLGWRFPRQANGGHVDLRFGTLVTPVSENPTRARTFDFGLRILSCLQLTERGSCHPVVSNHETDAYRDVVEVVKRWRAWFRRRR
jgi:hypothetical protein